ncbi:hypothetical protein EYF80_032521 [Liparis tanakae]|uniref:Uncharacterized protein n=1 Tax=Liparis tanakae TaxID=230148 RepID=A0A4Z2GX16_9TELE|nr:hypothetical protein EYF80_032521 [Liparis tanakae]
MTSEMGERGVDITIGRVLMTVNRAVLGPGEPAGLGSQPAAPLPLFHSLLGWSNEHIISLAPCQQQHTRGACGLLAQSGGCLLTKCPGVGERESFSPADPGTSKRGHFICRYCGHLYQAHTAAGVRQGFLARGGVGREQCEHNGLVEDCEIAVCQGKTRGQLWAPVAERVGRDSWKEAPLTERRRG